MKDAFVMAKNEILGSPKIPPANRREEAEKFCLLPEDTDHNVPAFFQVPITVTQKKRFVPPVQFPPPPHVFVGRKVEQFHILRALQSSRLVRVSGATGVGKADLVKAVCSYANIRLHMVGFHDILWVPYQEEIRSGEPFCYFQDLLGLLSDFSPAYRFLDKAQTPIAKLVDYFQLRRTLLVMDAKGFSTTEGLGKLGLFLEEFIKVSTSSFVSPGYLTTVWDLAFTFSLLKFNVKGTQNVRVVVIHQLGDEITTTKMPTIEQHICVDPLSYDYTVQLFATLCPRLVGSGSEGIYSAKDLHALLAPPDERSSRITKRKELIFNMIGEGNPQSVHSVANDLTLRQYEELLLLGKQNDENPLQFEHLADLEERIVEVQKELSVAFSRSDGLAIFKLQLLRDSLEKQRGLYSRAAVERRQIELLDQISEAAQTRDFSRAQELQTNHDDLETQKQHLPTIHQLKTQFDEITFEIEHAASAREWIKAQRLQNELDRLEAAIRVETNEENANLVDADKQLMATRASLEARIMQLEVDYKEACDANDFKRARQIDTEANRLKDARSTKPAGVDLDRQVRKLMRDLEEAKVKRNIDRAETIFKRLEETMAKLKLEQDAESTLGVSVESDSINEKSQNGPISLPPSASSHSRPSDEGTVAQCGKISPLLSDPPGAVRLSNANDEKAVRRKPPPRMKSGDLVSDVSRRSSAMGRLSLRDRQEPPQTLGPSPGAFRIPGPGVKPNASIEPSQSAEVSVIWCWKETSADLSNYTNRPSIVYGDPKDGWIKYRRRYNTMLESAFQAEGQQRECVIDVSPHSYKVNFDTMTQTNIRTGYEREVRRFVEDAPPSSAEPGRVESYLPAVSVSALPNATEVANRVLEEQVVLEQMIVDTLRKHTVPAQQVMVKIEDSPDDDKYGSKRSDVTSSGSTSSDSTERGPPGIKQFFDNLRSKKQAALRNESESNISSDSSSSHKAPKRSKGKSKKKLFTNFRSKRK